MSDLRSFFKDAVASFLDFVYPPLCVSCGELLASGKARVCHRCWVGIAAITAEHPLYIQSRSKLVLSGAIDDLYSLYVFEKEGAFQRVVHSLKYDGDRETGLELGRRLGAHMKSEGVTANFLVPIPLHKRKLRERGYNQSELIARGCSERMPVPVRTDLVRRAKFTQTQTTLSLEDRKANLADAFECNSEAADGRSIILVDDVITTGSTIESCGRILKRAGAKRIIAASAALAE